MTTETEEQELTISGEELGERIRHIANLNGVSIDALRKARENNVKHYIERGLAEKAMMDLEDNDIELYGVPIPEGFDGKRAVEALRNLPTDDVEEVVRYENCKFRFSDTCFSKHETADMDFCSCEMKANDS